MLVCKISPTDQRYLKAFTHDLDKTLSKYFSEKLEKRVASIKAHAGLDIVVA